MITLEQAMEVARTQHRAGQFAAAEATCHRIIAQQPGHAGALQLLWQIAGDGGRFEEALRWILAAPSENAAWHCDLGLTYRRLDRLDEAVSCYERAVTLQPDFLTAHLNLGEGLRALKRFDEAILSFARVLELQPGSAEAHCSLAAVFISMDRLDEAVARCERALACDPRSVRAHTNLGIAFYEQGQFEKAIRCQRRALECHPNFIAAHVNLGGVLLLLGHFSEGWREQEWRLSAMAPRFVAPVWKGESIAGQTILLHAEQGLGDTIQFLRYLPLVRARSGAARVVLECQPPLLRLLSRSGYDVVAPDGALPAFDRHLPLLSLPFVLGEFEPLPMAAPYLQADPVLRAAVRERMGTPRGLRVGLVWAGNPRHARDQRRSVPFAQLASLLRVPGVVGYAPHLHPPEELTSESLAEFDRTAALMTELDLVITVDTAAAHLAGALGRPVWTLLPFVPDWRWGLARDDTPWYPTMRLFRQRQPGDWDEVMQRVRSELERMMR